ncbi:aldehyde dehydrogenase family protein [Amycolatopsis sp. FDAARGOS 1241]|uniref:aldehyde dehydrogenase family protein n=1 Tax=Amycolatopsis sp. FDAARGOS 1241 TaxID=2778070 RepID=UPI0019505418|nr:aldehyde dehydrogenase family protein [Amycolatopsis sp. FDAARGOS 1241]QRP49100.1 aldehyde dehydrogenase family protein [Amycolatopsis sp. FDAARGOS 1241]
MEDRNVLYIGGEWVPATGNATIAVENPATEEVLARIPEGTADDVDRAVRAAREAFPAWSATTRAERAELLRKLHEGLAKRAEEIGETIARDVGTPLRIATRIQAALPQTDVQTYVDLLGQDEPEEKVGNSLIVREAAGVVAAITPWNYPLHQITAKLAPALAAGCTVVVKPSEVAPLSAYQLFDALHEAGFPAGVINLVTGYGPVAGEALATHPDVDVVSFTGSVRAGTRVAELAARSVKRVTLELGGKSANVILADADLATAVKVGVSNAFLNAGQTCTAWTRMLVPREKHEEAVALAKKFAEGFTPGDPLDAKTKLGPLVSSAQRERVRGYIEKGVAEGATLVTGGAEAPEGLDTGFFVRPTVFAGVDPDSTIAQEEIFGPVLSIIPFEDEEDALRIANNSSYGLHGAVWSADQDRALAFARRVRTGQIDVNGGAYNPLAPFGGYKSSGVGREMGRPALDEFTEIKSIQL